MEPLLTLQAALRAPEQTEFTQPVVSHPLYNKQPTDVTQSCNKPSPHPPHLLLSSDQRQGQASASELCCQLKNMGETPSGSSTWHFADISPHSCLDSFWRRGSLQDLESWMLNVFNKYLTSTWPLKSFHMGNCYESLQIKLRKSCHQTDSGTESSSPCNVSDYHVCDVPDISLGVWGQGMGT